MTLARIAAALAALTLATTAAPAQGTPTPQPVTQRGSIALLGIPFGLLSGEYERMTSSEISVGAAAGYVDFDDDSQAWGDVKLRYYPNARGPRGFAIGALVGVARVESDEFSCNEFSCEDTGESTATGATAGVFLDYAWLLGRSKRFYVGTGIGAKRVYGLDDDDRDYPEGLLTGRLQIGFAF